MDSALSPREIQARLRAGETLDEVAQAAGVPAEQIEPFAAPVLEERAYVARTAQAAPVRRLGEPSTNHQSLRSAIEERLDEVEGDPESVEWDAWQREKRKWIVQATCRLGAETRKAQFLYDQMGRFSLAHNDDARWLIGERPPSQSAPPKAATPRDPDHEPTLDYTDEFALVRAVGAEAPADSEPPSATPEQGAGDAIEIEEFSVTEISHVRTEHAASDNELGLGSQLTEVGGVYDIVPDTGGLDMIYDLLGGYSEESASYRFDEQPATPPPAPAEDRGDEESKERTDQPGEPPAEPQDFEGDVPDLEADADVAQPEPALGGTTTAPGEQPWAKLSRRQRRRLRQHQGAAESRHEFGEARDTSTPPERTEPALPQEDMTGEADRHGADDAPSRSDAGAERQEVGAAASGGAEGQAARPAGTPDEPPHGTEETLTIQRQSQPSYDVATPPDHAPSTDGRPESTSAQDQPRAQQPAAGNAEPSPAQESRVSEADEPQPEPATAEGAPHPVTEPTQDVLVESSERPKPSPRNKKRASVPSWDEIMFGGPKREQ